MSLQERCPAVTKNFLNAASCIRRPNCAPITWSSTSLKLDYSSLRKFYDVGGKLVYALTDLRLEGGDVAVSPCSGKSRWRRLTGGCGYAETALDYATKATLASAIHGSEDAANMLVRDIELSSSSGRSCTTETNGVSAIGAKVEVDGFCWEHSHPDLLNVYDATYWSRAHDGNDKFSASSNPIERFAKESGTMLHFPASHPMDRWVAKEKKLPLLGKLHDTVKFVDLPSSVQSFALAQAFGASGATSADAVEVCGSPGEVANDPTLGHKFTLAITPKGKGSNERYRQYSTQLGKSIVFNHMAIYAPDQLRQRVAWALAQIYVISDEGISKGPENEVWLTYHDIFTRNAFGSLRAILREVSYSPMMATYLSFLDSASLASSGSAPDENYARELMQLFSIGLWMLNEDGTQILDANGDPIPTYDTEDIMSFARAWTGFANVPYRGNLEAPNGDGSSNYVDPMQIRSQGNQPYRDAYPKTDLYDGYIGDQYPICADLPNREYLRKGARYSYLGHSPLPKKQDDGPIMLDDPQLNPRLAPDPTKSALYQRLCHAIGVSSTCTFPSEIVLSDDLPCDGMECLVDTAIVVKIQAGAESVFSSTYARLALSSPFSMMAVGRRRKVLTRERSACVLMWRRSLPELHAVSRPSPMSMR